MIQLFKAIGLILIFFLLYLMMSEPVTQTGHKLKDLKPWPPELKKTYPDLELIDQDGSAFNLSALKGKVIILQPVGMGSTACQAFAGGHEVGGYDGITPMKEKESLIKMIEKYAPDVKLPHPDIVVVQLLLYTKNFKQPTPEDAKKWAAHFGFKTSDHMIVAVSTYDMRGSKSIKQIPGFQLIDHKFILRANSSGTPSPDDLYKVFLPMVSIALEQKKG